MLPITHYLPPPRVRFVVVGGATLPLTACPLCSPFVACPGCSPAPPPLAAPRMRSSHLPSPSPHRAFGYRAAVTGGYVATLACPCCGCCSCRLRAFPLLTRPLTPPCPCFALCHYPTACPRAACPLPALARSSVYLRLPWTGTGSPAGFFLPTTRLTHCPLPHCAVALPLPSLPPCVLCCLLVLPCLWTLAFLIGQRLSPCPTIYLPCLLPQLILLAYTPSPCYAPALPLTLVPPPDGTGPPAYLTTPTTTPHTHPFTTFSHYLPSLPFLYLLVLPGLPPSPTPTTDSTIAHTLPHRCPLRCTFAGTYLACLRLHATHARCHWQHTGSSYVYLPPTSPFHTCTCLPHTACPRVPSTAPCPQFGDFALLWTVDLQLPVVVVDCLPDSLICCL